METLKEIIELLLNDLYVSKCYLCSILSRTIHINMILRKIRWYGMKVCVCLCFQLYGITMYFDCFEIIYVLYSHKLPPYRVDTYTNNRLDQHKRTDGRARVWLLSVTVSSCKTWNNIQEQLYTGECYGIAQC